MVRQISRTRSPARSLPAKLSVIDEDYQGHEGFDKFTAEAQTTQRKSSKNKPLRPLCPCGEISFFLFACGFAALRPSW